MKAPSLTIGIEEEYQIIDPATGELRSYITQILEDGKSTLREQVKAEMKARCGDASLMQPLQRS